jgi:hypothetical protein
LKNKAKTPQKPRFSRKMMGFDGGGSVYGSSTLRCTSKSPRQYAVGFCLAYRKSKQECYEFVLTLCAALRLDRSSSYRAPAKAHGNTPWAFAFVQEVKLLYNEEDVGTKGRVAR